jgi:hypothetical protein
VAVDVDRTPVVVRLRRDGEIDVVPVAEVVRRVPVVGRQGSAEDAVPIVQHGLTSALGGALRKPKGGSMSQPVTLQVFSDYV